MVGGDSSVLGDLGRRVHSLPQRQRRVAETQERGDGRV